MSLDLDKELENYGAHHRLRPLQEADAEALVRYVDLLPSSTARKRRQGVPLPDAVVEHDDRALVYVFRADSLGEAPLDPGFDEALRSLACRGEGSYAAIVYPGEIKVYPVGLMSKRPVGEVFRADEARNRLLIHDLAHGRAGVSLRQQLAQAKSLHGTLLKLLRSVAKELRACPTFSSTREEDHILPLLGRALFTRFLVDRGIVNASTCPKIYVDGGVPEDCFATPERAASTCAWLDETFNGDLLTLLHNVERPKYKDYLAFFAAAEKTGKRPLHHLGNVMRRAVDGRLTLALGWDGVDFAHVPIGLLSEVYEHYAHEFYRDDAIRESVWYTPRHIAEFTVEHAFMALDAKKRQHARVLDPAAGAGVFLVLALQRLVAERFQATGKRPDTHEIRKILYQQIRGYDINQSALTLAALSLYLTALELDPEPFPPEKLKFERLMDNVLRNMRSPAEKFPFQGQVLGSLGARGNIADDRDRYDVVVGNPPWTGLGSWESADGGQFNDFVEDMVDKLIAKHRPAAPHLSEIARHYHHNDHLPDTAFLWKSIEWARPGGVIALIVGGRFLFKRGDIGAGVREGLFQALTVTGVLNGTSVREIWPRLSQPFCIIVARNQAATPDSRFTMVSPLLDYDASGEPQMRIDAETRQPIDLALMLRERHLLKALTRGSRLDIEVIRRIQDKAAPTVVNQPDGDAKEAPPAAVRVADYFGRADSTSYGQGYFPGKPGPEQRKRLLGLAEMDALHLTSDDLIDKHGDTRIGLRVEARQLKAFEPLPMYRAPEASLFRPPLVLIKEGFGQSARGQIRARLYTGKKALIYRRNFYGFSCAWHPQQQLLAKYLFCVLNSDLLEYYTLQTSSKFGFERRTLLETDVEDFPLIAVEALSPQQAEAIEQVADQLSLDSPDSWAAMNRAVNKIYGLSAADEQVMRDALDTQIPYADAKKRALSFSDKDAARFVSEVKRTLKPFFDEHEDAFDVSLVPMDVPMWMAVGISTSGKSNGSTAGKLLSQIASTLAKESGASRIILEERGRVTAAVYKQYRFLTPSKARLLALDVLREHGKAFPLTA